MASDVSDPTVYDHYRPTEADVPRGVYRVVGTDGASVTLLRVADADGDRVHTGEVLAVDRETVATFAPAENPDDSQSLWRALASQPELAYWSVRAFVRQLVARPVAAAVAVALLLAGTYGERLLSLPDVAASGLFVAGALALAAIGSGRL